MSLYKKKFPLSRSPVLACIPGPRLFLLPKPCLASIPTSLSSAQVPTLPTQWPN